MSGFERKTAGNNTNDNFQKAAGFLNIDIVLPNGETMQVGGVPLKEGTELHDRLMSASPEKIADLQFSGSVRRVGLADEKKDALDQLFG